MKELPPSLQTLILEAVADSSDAILISDNNGIIKYWNSGAENIFGHTSDEAIGKSLDLIIPEPLRGRHWEGYNRVMATGETKYKTGLLSAPGVNKEGGRISLEFSMVLLHNSDGVMVGCASIMRDISDHFQKERGLQTELAKCKKELEGFKTADN